MLDRILHFRRKIDEFPDNPLYKYSLGQELFEQGQNKEAACLFEDCLLAKPDWMMPALFLSKAYLALGNTELAIKNLHITRKLATEQNHEDPLHEANELLAEIE